MTDAKTSPASSSRWGLLPYAIAAGLIAWALVPSNPYGYYQVMRWIVCISFAALALRAFRQGAEGWGFAWIALAGIYNPIVPIRADREIWTWINLATIGVVGAGFVAEQLRKRGRGTCVAVAGMHCVPSLVEGGRSVKNTPE